MTPFSSPNFDHNPEEMVEKLLILAKNYLLWASNSSLIKGSTKELSLHEKCPNSELFWSVFSHILTEYGEILHISIYSV